MAEDGSFQQEVLDDPRYDVSAFPEELELGNTSLPLNGMKNVLAALQQHSNTISSLQSTLDLSKSAAAALQATKSVQLPSTTDPLSKLNALHNAISAGEGEWMWTEGFRVAPWRPSLPG